MKVGCTRPIYNRYIKVIYRAWIYPFALSFDIPSLDVFFMGALDKIDTDQCK